MVILKTEAFEQAGTYTKRVNIEKLSSATYFVNVVGETGVLGNLKFVK